MKNPKITYLVTRTHGLKTHLIRPEEIQVMAKAKSLKEVADSLLKSEYAEEVSKIPAKEIDASTLERIFLKKLVERFYFLVSIPSGVQDFLREYSKRFEVENIRRIIRAKHVGETIEEGNLIPLAREYTLVNFPALLKANDVAEVAALLRETAYVSLTEKLDLYKKYGTTLVLEACLDDVYFGKLWEMVDKLPDKKEVKQLVGTEMDLKNILTVIGLRMRNVEPALIEEMLTSSFYEAERRHLTSFMRAGIKDAADALVATPYAKLVEEALSLTHWGEKALFSEVEKLFRKEFYGKAFKMLRENPFNMGFALAYLLACECEAKNLVTLSVGKDLKIGDEKIQKDIIG